MHYTAIVRQDGDWWIGWIKEVSGINCQEKSREELIDTMRVSLLEALELNQKEAIELAGPDYEEELISV